MNSKYLPNMVSYFDLVSDFQLFDCLNHEMSLSDDGEVVKYFPILSSGQLFRKFLETTLDVCPGQAYSLVGTVTTVQLVQLKSLTYK